MTIEIVDFPMKNGDFPVRFLYVYQAGSSSFIHWLLDHVGPSGNRTAVSHIASLASRYIRYMSPTIPNPAPDPAPRRRRQALAHSGCFSQKGSASNFTEPGLGISQTSGFTGPQGHPQGSKLWNPKMHHLMRFNTCHQGFLWKGLHLEANNLFLGRLSSGNLSLKTGNQPNKFPGETLFPIRSNHIQNKLNPPKLIIPTIQPTEKKDT